MMTYMNEQIDLFSKTSYHFLSSDLSNEILQKNQYSSPGALNRNNKLSEEMTETAPELSNTSIKNVKKKSKTKKRLNL